VRISSPPSPATVISVVALVLAAGGTGFAADHVAFTGKAKKRPSDAKTDRALIQKLAPTLSVKSAGSAKTADSAVHASSADVAASAVTAANATNATNATNAANATSATNATNARTPRSSAASRPCRRQSR